MNWWVVGWSDSIFLSILEIVPRKDLVILNTSNYTASRLNLQLDASYLRMFSNINYDFSE